jgi:hypothetical protein
MLLEDDDSLSMQQPQWNPQTVSVGDRLPGEQAR